MLSKDVQEMIPKIQKFFETQPVEKAWLGSEEKYWGCFFVS